MKRVWKCPNGCKNDKKICPHLDALLPKEESTSLLDQRQNYAGSNVDKYQPPVADRAAEKARFISKVSGYLKPIEVLILVLRYVFNEEFGNISKELKLLSVDTAIRVHDEALKKLKTRWK